MDVDLINYDELAEQARQEVNELNAPATTVQTLHQLIDSFVDIQNQQREMNWNYQWAGFSLKIPTISADVYNKFERIASKMKKSPGRVLSYLMEKALSRDDFHVSASDLKQFVSYPSIQIQHLKNLTITKRDLNDLGEGERVGIQHIKDIVIDSDIDAELFQEKVAYIQHCRNIVMPEGYSKLMVMSKTQFCKSYGFQ